MYFSTLEELNTNHQTRLRQSCQGCQQGRRSLAGPRPHSCSKFQKTFGHQSCSFRFLFSQVVLFKGVGGKVEELVEVTRVGTELFFTTCAFFKGVLGGGVPTVEAVNVGDILPAALPQRCDWFSVGDVLEVVQHLRSRHLLPIPERLPVADPVDANGGLESHGLNERRQPVCHVYHALLLTGRQYT